MSRQGGQEIALQVDGGVTAKTAPRCIEAGADVLVAGTAVFGAPDYARGHRCACEGNGLMRPAGAGRCAS